MREIKNLQLKQASIRDIQRGRLDDIHDILHQIERDFYRKELGGESKTDIKEYIEQLHNIIHSFMRGFDEAVLIHERIAEIKGDDPEEITKALVKVRNTK